MPGPRSADVGELAALALSIAREAGALILEHRAAGVEIADTKSSLTDIVTDADRASEDLIRERILAARPHDSVLGEEGSQVDGDSGVHWVVDPIDGTVNYAHGIPNYAVSIGVELDGEAVVGVVLNPAQGLEYTAVRGSGARRNGTPIRVAETVAVAQAVVGTGFNYLGEIRTIQARNVAAMLPEVADIRRFGSCALDLCAVADGSLDGYVEEGVGGAWDYTAGALIAAEAGAEVQVLTGVAGRILVTAAPRDFYPAFRDLLEACGFVR
jgi:myo-inositol-1(or 4)-monophosphatase